MTRRLWSSPVAVCAILALMCTGLILLMLRQALPHTDFRGLLSALTSSPRTMDQVVVWFSLMPRVVIALLTGAALGLAGTLMQQVLRNPIASPTTLGVASGAQLGLLASTLYAPGLLIFGDEWVALAGGSLSLLLVLTLSWHRRLAPVAVVLAGLVVNLYLGALSTVLILFNQEEFRGLMVWAAGSLAQNNWHDVQHLLPRLTVAVVLAALLARPLRLLELDGSNARSLGASVRQLRLCGLGLAVFVTATAVSLVGIVGFVGLAAPAAVRLMGARSLYQRLVWAPVFGALLLLTTDLMLQALSSQMVSLIPTGAMTGVLGAPLLLWLIPRLALKGGPAPASSTTGILTLAVALVMVIVTPLMTRWLDVLPLGRSTALGLGIGVNRAKLALLVIVALLTALATLIVGPLSFAGLLAPHLARMLGLVRALPHLLGAALIGALLLVTADWTGRQILFPQEIPAGLVSALLGGAYFMWGLRKR